MKKKYQTLTFVISWSRMRFQWRGNSTPPIFCHWRLSSQWLTALKTTARPKSLTARLNKTRWKHCQRRGRLMSAEALQLVLWPLHTFGSPLIQYYAFSIPFGSNIFQLKLAELCCFSAKALFCSTWCFVICFYFAKDPNAAASNNGLAPPPAENAHLSEQQTVEKVKLGRADPGDDAGETCSFTRSV